MLAVMGIYADNPALVSSTKFNFKLEIDNTYKRIQQLKK